MVEAVADAAGNESPSAVFPAVLSGSILARSGTAPEIPRVLAGILERKPNRRAVPRSIIDAKYSCCAHSSNFDLLLTMPCHWGLLNWLTVLRFGILELVQFHESLRPGPPK